MLCREMSHSNTYGLTTMNAMLTSQDCICHCLFSPANEMSDNNTYGLTTMNAMLTSQDCICHCLFSPANEMNHNNTYGLTRCLNNKWAIFQLIIVRKSSIQWNDDDDDHFVLDQHV
jgi:hypothetical protein